MRLDRFWLLHRNVDRLDAERDFRNLRVAIGSASGEGANATFALLKKELGNIAEFDHGRRTMAESIAPLDSAGLSEIAQMGSILS